MVVARLTLYVAPLFPPPPPPPKRGVLAVVVVVVGVVVVVVVVVEYDGQSGSNESAKLSQSLSIMSVQLNSGDS